MKKRTKSKSVDAEEKLLLVGEDHFLKNGARLLSVRKVAQEAGVNLGSFVYHFKTKDEFLARIFGRLYSQFLLRFDEELAKAHQGEPIETLRGLIEVMADFVVSHDAFFARLCLDIFSGEKSVLNIFVKSPPPHFSMMISLIKEGQDRGQIRTDMTPFQIALNNIFSVGVLHVLGLQAVSHLKSPAAKAMRAQILDPDYLKGRIDFIIKGMGP
jgi:AcrR family transcriptional regulator